MDKNLNSKNFKDDAQWEIAGSFVIELAFKSEIGSIHFQPDSKEFLHINKRQQDIMDILAVHKSLSLKDIVDQLPYDVHKRLVRDDLYRLKEYGFIDTLGHGRGATWYRTQQEK